MKKKTTWLHDDVHDLRKTTAVLKQENNRLRAQIADHEADILGDDSKYMARAHRRTAQFPVLRQAEHLAKFAYYVMHLNLMDQKQAPSQHELAATAERLINECLAVGYQPVITQTQSTSDTFRMLYEMNTYFGQGRVRYGS